MAGTTDFQLLGTLAVKAQRGDAAACEVFLGQLYAYVRGILAGKFGAFADLDDLTQECLLGMHKSLSSYHPSRNIKPWVHAIIRYKSADHFRVLARRRESALTGEVADPSASPAGRHDVGGNGMADRVDLQAMLASLSPPLGRAVVLTKLEGLSCEEAARREGVGAAALRKRVSRAYEQLAVLIERNLEPEDHAR